MAIHVVCIDVRGFTRLSGPQVVVACWLRRIVVQFVCFFFQAEDGIRDGHVTGVQTCALPISDGDERDRPDPALPLADPRETLRSPGHRLQQRRVDRAERHIVRLETERARELGLIVGADAEPHPGASQPRHVRALEIPLPEMHELATRRECELPIVVDDQLHAGRSAAGLRLSNLLEQSLPRLLLDAQLHQVHPERREAPHPGGAVDDRIDARQPHPRKAVPMTGVEGSARSRGSIGPASRAALPASTACANAAAMPTGSRACAIAVLISTASKPSSRARAACEGTPIPASMIRGTAGKCARSAARPKRLFKPRPEPMGDPHGISTRQPAESSRSATTRSSVVYGNTSKPSAHRRRAASASPNGSGCRVSSSPITSSLIHVVANTSRAMCAVVTASFTEWQPAVLGSTRTLRPRMIDQNPSPRRSPPDSRRSATVTTSARAARTASVSTAGEG